MMIVFIFINIFVIQVLIRQIKTFKDFLFGFMKSQTSPMSSCLMWNWHNETFENETLTLFIIFSILILLDQIDNPTKHSLFSED